MGTDDEPYNVEHVNQTGCITMAERSKTINGLAEGSGSHTKGLHVTYLGRWLTLFRVQSLPISAVIASMGYLVVAETIIFREVLGLVAVAALAHAGINAQNDVMDYHTDLKNKQEDKPLISGDITYKQATFASSVLVGSSIVASVSIFPSATPLFLVALTSAVIYNYYSSKSILSPVIFGVWGMSFSIFGAFVGSPTFNVVGILYGVSMGVLTSTFIFYGNVIDSESGERSIHSFLGGEALDIDGETFFIPGDSSKEDEIIILFSFWTALLLLSSYTILGVSYSPIVIVALMSFSAYKMIKDTCYPVKLDNEIKRDFIIYVITTSSMTLGVFGIAAGIQITLFIILLSILWAVFTMKIMYGRWFYFP